MKNFNIMKFIANGFNNNLGYSVLTRGYNYCGKPYIGYVLVKNYIFFWIPGYDRLEVFCDKKDLNLYLDTYNIIIK